MAASNNNKLDIVQRACSATGNGVITSLDDNSDLAVLVNQHYEGLYESMLTAHAWLFARRVTALEKVSTIPVAPWSALYAQPPLCLSLQSVSDRYGNRVQHEQRDSDAGTLIAISGASDNPLYGYTHDADYFGAESTPQYPDGPPLYATYTVRVPEGRLPADLAKALQYRLEAVFLRSVSEQRQEADRREQMAEMVEARARARDRRAASATDPTVSDLALARYRGSGIGVRRFA